jgi:hypothetical protein
MKSNFIYGLCMLIPLYHYKLMDYEKISAILSSSQLQKNDYLLKKHPELFTL